MKSRRIYTSGKSQVLAVPSDWYNRLKKKMGEDADVDVLVRTYGDLLLVLPMLEPEEKQTVIIEVKNPEVMECDLKSHYMFGKDKVVLKTSTQHEEIESKLGEISKKLYGMHYVTKSRNEIIVDFSPPTVPVTELLEREFNLYDEMQKEISDQLETFPQIGEKSSKNRMEILENDVDKTSYQAKRSLIKALYDPVMLVDLGLRHFADVLGYYRVEENFERLADLQRQIFSEIQDLKLAYKKFTPEIDLNRFNNFYKKAHELVVKSYSGSEIQGIASVIRNKTQRSKKGEINTAYDYHEELILWLTTEGIPNLLPKRRYTELSKEEFESYNTVIKSLWQMESRIYGMVGNASNIAESRLFMLARNPQNQVQI